MRVVFVLSCWVGVVFDECEECVDVVGDGGGVCVVVGVYCGKCGGECV